MMRKLEQLGTIEGMTLDEYRRDPFRVKGTEKLLQETVEAAVDANLHLLRATGAPVAGDYYESFVALGRHGVIPAELAARLAPAAGLRNRLVHEYDVVDDAVVLESVRQARQSFREYATAVEAYLSGQGA